MDSHGHPTMREFMRNSLSPQKLRQLYVKAAFSNFVGYVAGTTVTILTTYQTVERRALKNLFGILPRKTVVVHRLPEWLEWTLCIILGYLVMEIVRYVLTSSKVWLFVDGAVRGKAGDDDERLTTKGRPSTKE